MSSSSNEYPRSLDASFNNYILSLEERQEAASQFLRAHNYDVVHQNGQRISTHRLFNEQAMNEVEWNEIFIGKLPRDMFEDELLPHLVVCGLVFKIRYMMDFSGYNRGFCFVKYASTDQAIKAIHYLDGLILRHDLPPIGAKISFDNKCLFIGNIPTDCTSQQLIRALQKAEVGGITDVRLAGRPRNTYNNNNNNYNHARRNHRHNQLNSANYNEDSGRYCYVYFESHDDATRARRILLPGEVKLYGRKLTLDWAKSEVPSHISELLRTPQLTVKPTNCNPFKNATDLWSGSTTVSPNWQSLYRHRQDMFDVNCAQLRVGQYICPAQPDINPLTQQPVNCSINNTAPMTCHLIDGLRCSSDSIIGGPVGAGAPTNRLNDTHFIMQQPCQYTEGHSFQTTLLLAIFLGMFGADRFYLGYYAIGLLKFCTFGFMLVGQLLDIILITTHVLRPASGSYYVIDYFGPKMNITSGFT